MATQAEKRTYQAVLPWQVWALFAILVVGMASLLAWTIYDVNYNGPIRRMDRATNEARCHAAAELFPYPAYAILKSESSFCQIMLPEGGLPVGLSWSAERYE